MFCYLFHIAMAFPSSLLVLSISPYILWCMSFFGPKEIYPSNSEEIIFFFTILILGYFQWFVLIPSIAAEVRSYIHDKSLSSPQTGKYLTNGLHWARLTLRWGGCGYFLFLAWMKANIISLAYVLGAFVVVLVFRLWEFHETKIELQKTNG